MLRREQIISTERFVAAQFRLIRHFESGESLDDGLPTYSDPSERSQRILRSQGNEMQENLWPFTHASPQR